MPKLILDGRELTYEGKKTILQVAQEHGCRIPHYCWHPGLSVVASCRICLAEVEQPNPKSGKLELIPKLVPTCQTPAVDGMVVHMDSPKTLANQKAVMEYLLINHPLDCPVCDQAGECKLQDYSYRHGRSTSRFEETKIKQPVKDIGPHVKLYSDRCIMCTRCVRFTREVTGTGELSVFGRGSREQIDVFPGRPLDNELSGNVVDICPVGALLDKDFLFTQRVWFLTATPSIDGLTASGDNISIHHNDGQIYRLKPRKNAKVNQWWISDEIRYGWKFIHAPERLAAPKRMQFGVSVETDWAKAVGDAVDGLTRVVREKGDAGLALLVSPMLASEEAYLLGKLIRALAPNAVLGVGPIPTHGENKTFPGGYTIVAEKAPNARGVRRALEMVAGGESQVLDFAAFIARLSDKATSVGGLIVTGNYPGTWAIKDVLTAASKKFLVVIDTLPSDLTARADVLLPSVTWAEKSGCFENHAGLIQAFEQAIAPVADLAKPEGQIALDLLACHHQQPASGYDAAAVRQQMAGPFASDVALPNAESPLQADMEYVEL